MKTLFTILAALLLSASAFAQNQIDTSYFSQPRSEAMPDFSVPFAQYDTLTLSMDVYLPPVDTLNPESDSLRYCVLHAYGGGFLMNNQKTAYIKDYCRRLANDGYVAIAIDYRLGLVGVKMHGVLSMVKPLMKCIHMASEDMFRATACVLEHADEWKIRKDGIIISGSSAGAITALQSDYEFANGKEVSKVLPEDFRYAGVVSLAGAVLSEEGVCKYKLHDPAPTLMLHGTKDKLVTYNNIAFFNLRFSGSNDLVKQFKKGGYSFELIRYEGEGHGVAGRGLESYPEIIWFLENMVKGKKFYQIDKTVWDRDHEAVPWDQLKPEQLY